MLRVHFVAVIAILSGIAKAVPETNDNSASSWKPSELMVQLYKEMGQRSPFTPNKTTDDEKVAQIIVDLLEWSTPEYIAKNFPYYFAGYSQEGRPVWVVEAGKFDLNDLTGRGPEMVEKAEIAFEQAILRIFKSMDDGREGDDLPHAQVILDLDGINLGEYAQPQALALLLKMAYRYVDVGIYGLENAILINSNFFVEALVTLMRPALGNLMERVEIYGTNKETWQPRLQKLLPPFSLPPWYGGNEGFKPVAAYG